MLGGVHPAEGSSCEQRKARYEQMQSNEKDGSMRWTGLFRRRWVTRAATMRIAMPMAPRGTISKLSLSNMMAKERDGKSEEGMVRWGNLRVNGE
jgi:hypothetical protein